MIKAVIYARYSSSSQTEQSIQAKEQSKQNRFALFYSLLGKKPNHF